MTRTPPGPAVTLPLDDPHYRAIGHVMAQWAFLEREINVELRWLKTKARNRRTQVNYQARFSRRCTAWITMATRIYSQQAEIAAVRRIAGRADRIKSERDDLAHGTFLGHPGGFQFAVFREGQLVNLPDNPASAADIENLANRISEITADLMKHQDDIARRYRNRP